MRIKVKNLGKALKEADIDLSKRLLVFTGPNNSGRTYLAYTIYGLFDYIGESTRHDSEAFELKISEDYSNLKIKEIEVFVTNILSGLIDSYPEYLSQVFASNKNHFKNAIIQFSDTNFDFRNSLKKEMLIGRILENNNTIEIKLVMGQKSDVCRLIIEQNIKGKKQELTFKEAEQAISSISLESMNWLIFYSVIFKVLNFRRNHFETTERTSLNIFSKELSIKRKELVEEILESSENKVKFDPMGIIEKKAKRYPLPIRDGLSISDDLELLSKNESEFGHLSSELEKKILNGKIKVSPNGEMLYAPDFKKRGDLDIHLSGSMIKSLASLAFYFRHIALKGDSIIIDEPELNLHPENQVKFARFLAMVVNEGFQVIISTHSDYIIRELNSLIMLSKKGKISTALRTEYKIDKKEVIKPEDVGVYSFPPANSKKVVREIPVDETGFVIEDIDKTIVAQNERVRDIYMSIFSGED